jgi:hypothetical protein
VPATSQPFSLTLPSIPTSYAEDYGNRHANTVTLGNTTSDVSKSNTSNTVNNGYSRKHVGESLDAQADELGIEDRPRHHTSRKRQALEGAIRALQAMATPQGQAMLERGGIGAAIGLIGSGVVSGAAQKNVLGQERLTQDVGQAQNARSRALKERGERAKIASEEADTAYKLKRPDLEMEKLKASKEKEQMKITAKREDAERKALIESGKVKDVQYIADPNGDVYRSLVYQNGRREQGELVTRLDADGNRVPLKKAEAVAANMRITIAQQNADTMEAALNTTTTEDVTESTEGIPDYNSKVETEFTKMVMAKQGGDPRFKGMSSLDMLKAAQDLVKEREPKTKARTTTKTKTTPKPARSSGGRARSGGRLSRSALLEALNK